MERERERERERENEMLEIIPRTFVQANTNASELFQMTQF